METILGVPLSFDSVMDKATGIPTVAVGSVLQIPTASVHLISQSVTTTSTVVGKTVCEWVKDHGTSIESLTSVIPDRTFGPVKMGPVKVLNKWEVGPVELGPVHIGPMQHETAEKIGQMGKAALGAAGGITHSAFEIVGSIGGSVMGLGPVGVVGASMECAERVVNATLGGFAEVGHCYNEVANIALPKLNTEDGQSVDDSKKKWDSAITKMADLRGVRTGEVPKFVGLSPTFDEKHLYVYGKADASVFDDALDQISRRDESVIGSMGKLVQHSSESCRAMLNTVIYSTECVFVRIQQGVVTLKVKLLSFSPIPMPAFRSVDACVAVFADFGRSLVGSTFGIVYASLGCARNVGKAMQTRKNCDHQQDGIIAAGIHGAHDIVNASLCSVAAVGCAMFSDVGEVGCAFIDDVLGSTERMVEKVPRVGKPMAFVTVGAARRMAELPFKAGSWAGCKLFGGIAALGGCAPVEKNPVTIPEARSSAQETQVSFQYFSEKIPFPLSSRVSTYQPAVPNN